MTDPGLPLTTGEGGATLGENVNWLLAECGRLREQLAALREAFQTYVDATTFVSSLPGDIGSPAKPSIGVWSAARAALGVEGEQEKP